MTTRSRTPVGRYLTLSALACIAGLGSIGCKAKEATNAGFIDKSEMYADASLPFHKVWKKPGFDKSKYSKVYVAPVNTSYMLAMTDWQKGERRDQITSDIAALGLYTQNALKKALKEDPNHRMQVVESLTPSPDTLVLEMALIEVVPSKVTLNALGYAPFFIGTTVTAVRTVAADQSTVACEVRVRDASTGEVVATFADREAEQMAVVSARGLTWYSHAEKIIDTWAVQLVQTANRKQGEVIKDTDSFTLQPW